MANKEEKQLSESLNAPKQQQISELLSGLIKQKFIEQVDSSSENSVVITTSVTYHNGPAIKIRISKEPSNPDDLLLSDDEHTIRFLRETIGDSWSLDRFDQSLNILKQPVIECAGNVLLSHTPSDSTSLASALTQFVTLRRRRKNPDLAGSQNKVVLLMLLNGLP